MVAPPDPPTSANEPFLARFRRRALTIPGLGLAFVLVVATLPALLLVALLLDLTRPSTRFSLLRLTLFLVAFLATETVGLALLFATGILTLGSPTRRQDLTWPVQRLYTRMHMAAASRLFGLRFRTEGDDLGAEGGPVVVLVRHASLVDTLVPGVFLANRHHLKLRYVLKRELLLDPCLDVAGHWLPNHFVRRDGSHSDQEIQAVGALKRGIGSDEGVLIYPEGTRFSAQKRRVTLERLRDDPALHGRASRLRHLLPIRPGGVLALLEQPPVCDVLLLGHHGLEGLTTLREIANGSLVGRTIHVKLWRARAADIPSSPEARLDWLSDHWQTVDDWLASFPPEGPSHA